MTRKEKVALILVILSTIVWLVMFAVPFFPLTNGEKAAWASACFIAAEVLFWGAILYAGKDVVSRFTVYLNPKNWKQLFNQQDPTSLTGEHINNDINSQDRKLSKQAAN